MEESTEKLTMITYGIKMTVLEYPFDIRPLEIFVDDIIMPGLLTLAAMKAYSLGRRSKWKDYIGLYFILRDHLSLKEISRKAKEIFSGGFDERLFRKQSCYFEGNVILKGLILAIG